MDKKNTSLALYNRIAVGVSALYVSLPQKNKKQNQQKERKKKL